MRSANITRSLTTTLILCCAPPALLHAQAGETFLIHGTARSCSGITQLDSALADDSQQFFTGWDEKDYADAAAWAQACAEYGWHVASRPRLPLLKGQHDRAMAAVAAVQPAVATQPSPGVVPDAAGAAPGSDVAAVQSATAIESTPMQAGVTTPATVAAQEPLLESAAPGIPLTAPAAQTDVAPQAVPASEAEEESVVTGEYFKKHFHQESLWVANRAHLDIGDDRGPATWPTAGTSGQLKNRLTADKIVLYCARKTNASEASTKQRSDPDNQPLLWDWRWCEAEEAAAYNRLVTGNEFPSAGRGVVLGCAGSDSYIYTERCIQTLSESARN